MRQRVIHPGWRPRLLAGLLAAFWAAGAGAGVTEAAKFYEDAAKHFEQGDNDGAIVQLKNSIQQNKQQVAAHLLLAKVYAAKGDPRNAQTAYAEALNQGADASEVAVPLARIDLSMGQPEAALQAVAGSSAFPRAVQVDALALRGAAYTQLSKPALAAQAFDEARSLDPNSVAVLLAEGEMLLRTGQLPRARADAAKAIELEPGNEQAWTMNAVTLRESGDVKGSLAAFDKAVELSPANKIEARLGRAVLLFDLGRAADAQKDIVILVKQAPKSLRILTLQGMSARAQGNNALAKSSFTEAAGVIDAIPPALLNLHEQDMMMAAVVHHELGDRLKAMNQLDAVLAKYPEHIAARRLQASIYLEGGEFGRARPVLESLRRTFPDDPMLTFGQGQAELGLGRYAQAVALLQAASTKIDGPAVRLALGSAQIGAGQDDAGTANLEKAYAATHDLGAARKLSGVYLRHGQAKRALALGESAVKQAPSNPAALTLLGEIRGDAGDPKGARDAFTKASGLQANYGPALVDLARLDLAEGNVKAARDRLQAMSAKAVDPRVQYQLGLIEQADHKPDAALAQFQRAAAAGSREAVFAVIDQLVAMRRIDEAVTAAGDFQQKRPQDLGLRLALAHAETLKGDVASARSELKDATALAEYDPDTQVQIGRLQLDAGNPAGAAYNAQKALAARPDDLQAQVLTVAAAIVAKDFAEADKAQGQLSAHHPNQVETLLSAAGLAMAKHQFPDAIATYKRALGVSETPENALALGRAMVISGDPAGAARFYADWIKKRPNDEAVVAALAEAQFQSGQLAESKRNYQAILATNSGNARLQNNYANLLLAMGDPAGAKSAAEAALRLDPKAPAYMDTLGWALVEAGQTEAGLPYVREARLRSPDNPEIRIHLAIALNKAGNKSSARDELSSVLKVTPQVASIPVVAKLKGELGL